MSCHSIIGIALGVGVAACAASAAVSSASASSAAPLPETAPASCASLTSLALPGTTIRAATQVTGGTFALPGATPINRLSPFCRVEGTTTPAINFEVWLPLNDWNGKIQGVGNGANGGSISYPAMATALQRGYAASSTDTGHTTTNGRDATWAVGHPELVADFGYRAIHETAVNAKAVVQAFYRQAPEHAYFVACSTGGRQALMEAQRFPEDYDGIIAGDPAANWTRFQIGGHLWIASALNKDPDSYIPASRLPLIDAAVTSACDAIDGIRDGVIDDPRHCHFDPQRLVCAAGQDLAGCLTTKQARALKDIWSGAHDASGREVYPAYMPGAESGGGWASYMTGTGPLTGNHWEQAENVLKYMVFENPRWDFRTFDFGKDTAFAVAKLGSTLDAYDPNLKPFRDRGGKLLLYHGWNDPSISPLNTINYYEAVISAVQGAASRHRAEEETQAFARLFMVPGMLHCTGGPGPSRFDMVAALEAWTEKGQAPNRVIASHATNGVVDRMRPLCPYPQVAVYSGAGGTDAAANFSCTVKDADRQSINVAADGRRRGEPGSARPTLPRRFGLPTRAPSAR